MQMTQDNPVRELEPVLPRAVFGSSVLELMWILDRISYEGETLIALDLRAGEGKLGLGRRPESWEWSGWVRTARTIHLDRFSAQNVDSGPSSCQI